jgi:Tol biopolymer transport system component
MSRKAATAATVFAVAMTMFGYAAPDEKKAAVLLKAAEIKEVIEGDVKGAIPLYAQAAEEAGSNRALAAKALYGLGEAYRKTGSPAARDTFTRIVEGFSETKDVVMAARARLAASNPPQARGDRTERMVVAADDAIISSVSADGSVAVGLTGIMVGSAQQPQVTIWNLSSGESRILVPSCATAKAWTPVMAPNGRTVAYQWNETTDGKAVMSLRVIGTEPGAAVRLLPSPAGATAISPLAWSPDGGSLLVGSRGIQGSISLDWLTLADGTYRRVKSFEQWQQPLGFTVAPDGLIAYSAVPRQGSEDFHIFVIDSSGQNEVAVVNAAGRSRAPRWTPDGEHLLFVSDRSGGLALWSVGVRDGRPTRDPERLALPVGVPMAMTRSGQLYYQTTNQMDVSQVAFVGDLEPSGARITKTFVGEGLSWSPDGKFLAYIRNTAAPLAVMIRNVETGEERAYPQPRLGLQQARWLPDGSGVVVFVRDSSSVGTPGAIHLLDVSTGEFKRLVAIPQGRAGVVAVSHDGKSLYVPEGGTGTRRVFCVDLATGSERVVGTFANGGQTAPGLSVSPDGSSLVLQAWADQAKRLTRLLVLKTDGSGTSELLAPFPADRTQSILKWASDGRFIYYVTTAENGDWRLMRISPNGGTPESAGVDSTKLSGTIRIPALGRFSPLSMDVNPEGTQIVLGHRPAPHVELWVRDDLLALIPPRQ